MNKKFVVRLLVAGLSLFSLIYLSDYRIVVNASGNEGNATTATNRLRNELKFLSFNLNRNAYENKDIDFGELIFSQNDWLHINPRDLVDTPFARVNNDMVLNTGDTLAAHSAKLSNETGISQTMSTASFTYTQTDSITTSTTHSAGVSLTTSTEMKFPFVSGSMSMTAKYDFNHTNAVQSTVEKKWEVPSQNVVVPAGHHYNVNWVLKTGVATGTTNLTSSVNAVIPYKKLPRNVYQVWLIGDAIDEQDKLVAAMPSTEFKWDARSNWEKVDRNNVLRKWGTSKYTAKFGTELLMVITVVSNTRFAPVIVNEITMNVTPKIIE